MHIGIDARLPFYQKGGISQYTLHLLLALAKIDQSNRYSVYQMAKDKDTYTPAVPNFNRKNLYTPCHHRWERFTLGGEILLGGRPQVLHSPDFIPPLFGAKHNVITVHDLNFIHFPQFLTADSLRYYKGQISSAVKQSDHISADSHHTRQDLIDLLNVPAEKITTVHLSVNPLYQKHYSAAKVNQTLAELNLPKGFILAVGTLEPRKNLEMLVEAYSILNQDHAIDIPLVLVGKKGWLVDGLFQKILSSGLSKQVIHLEGVFDEKLAHLYHAAGVLVTPSHYEGFGLPALEALNCGCPIIVSNQGSLPEIAGDAGKMLPPNSPAEWATAITLVLKDTALREKMIAAGKKHAATFSWQKAAEQTLRIYNQVAT
ncbi:MAG: glycosyltransferase involved in cell wall biosynthesis [Cellvibrionaceae bacterium]|jgi:glycosyltransferase involved in cell wall biosynthesis